MASAKQPVSLSSTLAENDGLANGTEDPLFSPRAPESTRMMRFLKYVCQKHGVSLYTYEDLYNWSVDHFDKFWETVADWEETRIHVSQRWTRVVDAKARIDTNPSWFEGAKLNYAENMLQCRNPAKTALIELTEATSKGTSPEYKRITYAQLYDDVRRATHALRKLGVQANDRVAYYGPNCAQCVVACLAVTSLGAIWSSTAADFGAEGVLNRFVQIRPSVLISANAVRYNGKIFSHLDKLRAVLKGMGQLKTVLIDYVPSAAELDQEWIRWTDLLASGNDAPPEIDFYQASFDHPLWVLYSSGTTGKPKAIVHRAGGMLLQSRKEHLLHGDMSSDDVFFYFTTPGWMMWNYLISGLSFGCTLVLFDGSPLYDPSLLWRVAEDLKVTVFGTSAKYIEVLSKGYEPKKHHNLSALRQILSTGSPLAPDLFDWVYRHIKSHIILGSITGGTDICSLFCGHNAALPVYRGELQCRCLGMAVEVWDEDGKQVARGEAGDLVCTRPFPCMPIFFWNDDDGSRYRASYFEQFPGVWHHGDYCSLTESRSGNGGGFVMLGRSDAVLNPSGVRFGSGEITSVIESLPASLNSPVEDTLAVGLKIAAGDEKVILFLKLQPGKQLEPSFVSALKAEIRQRRSARHVPAEIIAVEDVPYTINNKKVEVPVKKLLNGTSIAKINAATLRNPECLAEYERIGHALRAALHTTPNGST